MLAAAGGMLVPAIFFTAFNHGTMAANGWESPHRHGHRLRHRHPLDAGQPRPRCRQNLPHDALAVADDLGAILVIALFYGGKVQITCLLVALVIMLGSTL